MKAVTLPMADVCRTARFRVAILLAVIVLVTELTGMAAEHPEQDAHLAVETGVEFQPRLGEYHYEIRWARQRVATGIIAIRNDGDQYVLTADQRTTEFVDRIYRVRYRGETRIDAADLAPVASTIEEEVKKRRKVQRAKYDKASGTVTVEETRTRGSQAEKEAKAYEIQSDTGILDVFSAIFLARSFDWSIGERHAFMVFIGEKQYDVFLDCIGMDAIEIEGNPQPVWVIQPGIRKSTETELSSVSQKTRIFIAADESRDIVKIKTQPGIGTVTLRLVKYLE
ncbi:DUF3108 domain-containing protein [uncultured Desulfosarcina sp.]|uniref:DUF3108 domain-containing protein n=1 Tax=uncultured Desulfosarcina sp. TaxID=218289 RepID=UPI0029C791BD|nr:DUF3108 domain-containing protein [uncultured Desulfosarcina sp.]